jgi:hypothetical protein
VSIVIKIDVVLREAVATQYRDLVTRPTGAAVRDRVLMVLRDSPQPDAHLDFTGVGLMDFSCADEIIAKLLVAFLDDPLQRIMLHGIHDNHADAIEHALVRYDLTVVARLVATNEPTLLGAAPADWRAAFRALTQLGRVTAPPVADALAWPVARTTDALRGLADHRCVVAHPDATFELGAVA